MSLIESFVRNPVKVIVGVIIVSMFGLMCAFTMPMQLTPEVQTPTLTIETTWPGASPDKVEKMIIQEQELQLKSVEGVVKMTSQSMDSKGVVTLEFGVGADMSEALVKVNSRLQQVREYPEDADQPVILTSNSSDRPIAWIILGVLPPSDDQIKAFQTKYPQLTSLVEPLLKVPRSALRLRRSYDLWAKEGEKHPELKEITPPPDDHVPKLRKFAEDVIETRLERVEGVSNSNVIGGQKEQMEVVVDPHDLAAHNVTIEQVRRTLRNENADTAAGDFYEGKRRMVVRALGEFRTPQQVENQIVARGEKGTIYIRDVAKVELGYRKPDDIVRRFGTRAISLNVIRETGANVIDVMEGVKKAIVELNQRLADQNLLLTQVYDETEYIHASVHEMNENLAAGAGLTIIVLLIFLKSFRSMLIIAIAIPVSTIGTFMFMAMLGRTLNVISLAGLAFAVGMLVDNAIVVLENIYRHRQLGATRIVAAVRGTQEVWGAVVSSSLANLAVFVPVIFVQDEAGQLFRDIALAISGALALSMVVAVIFVPMAASHLLRDKDIKTEAQLAAEAERKKNSTFYRTFSPLFLAIDKFGSAFVATVVGINAWSLGGVVRRIVLAGVMVAGAGALTYFLWPKMEYLPNGNRNLVIGIMLPPPGYNIDQLNEVGAGIEEGLRKYWDIDADKAEHAGLDYPAIKDMFFIVRGKQVIIGMRSAEESRSGKLVPLAIKTANTPVGTIGFASQSSLFEQGLGTGRAVDVDIVGPELTELIRLGTEIRAKVTSLIPKVQVQPKPSLDLSSPEIHVTPKVDDNFAAQLDSSSLGYLLNAMIDGAYAADYYVGSDKIDLVIKGKDDFVTRSQDVKRLPIAISGANSLDKGSIVELGTLADVTIASGPEQVNRRERQRSITLSVRPPVDFALESTVDVVNAEIIDAYRKSGKLPVGYDILISGAADKLKVAWNSMKYNFLLALILTYLLMAALFESWSYPLVIILSVPLGAVGGVLGIHALNAYLGILGENPQQLDILTMLGFVILVGTVVNNPILIVHQALNHMREDGMQPVDSVLESVRTRIRPIFMTTVTALLGLFPMVLKPSTGGELYRGLGAVLLGGMIVSTVFTLFLVPTLFSLMMDAGNAVRRLLGWQTAPADFLDHGRAEDTGFGGPRLDNTDDDARYDVSVRPGVDPLEAIEDIPLPKKLDEPAKPMPASIVQHKHGLKNGDRAESNFASGDYSNGSHSNGNGNHAHGNGHHADDDDPLDEPRRSAPLPK